MKKRAVKYCTFLGAPIVPNASEHFVRAPYGQEIFYRSVRQQETDVKKIFVKVHKEYLSIMEGLIKVSSYFQVIIPRNKLLKNNLKNFYPS